MDSTGTSSTDNEPNELDDIIYDQSEVEVYPDYVIEGVKRALQQAKDGLGKPYSGLKDMLGK